MDFSPWTGTGNSPSSIDKRKNCSTDAATIFWAKISGWNFPISPATLLKRIIAAQCRSKWPFISKLATQAAEFSLHGSNLRAELDMPHDLWKAAVDPAQIEQVINALIINAREAMPNGGTIRVSASNAELDQDSAVAIRPGRYI